MHTNPLQPGWLAALNVAVTTVFVLCGAGLLAACAVLVTGHYRHDDRLEALGYTCTRVAVIACIAASVALIYVSFSLSAGSLR